MMDTHLYISACVVLTPPVGDIGMTPGYGITPGYSRLLCFDIAVCSEALKQHCFKNYKNIQNRDTTYCLVFMMKRKLLFYYRFRALPHCVLHS